MMSNPHHFRHYQRQPNVLVTVVDLKGEIHRFLHRSTDMDVFVIGNVTMLEIREYPAPEATEPINVVNLVNPIKWTLTAKPDPEVQK